MAPRETKNNAYAKFWGDKQRTLWYVTVISGVVNCESSRVSLTRQMKLGPKKKPIWRRSGHTERVCF